MSYQEFAAVLSVVGVVLYAALVVIAARRAHLGRHYVEVEPIVLHARKIEGPLLTALFVVALGMFVSASLLNSPAYTEIVKLTLSLVRGFLIVTGAYVAGWYWTVRQTWL